MPSKLSYFVVAAWRASVVTAVIGIGILTATLVLSWMIDSSGRSLADLLPRTLRSVALALPALWGLVFVLEFGSRRLRRNRSRGGRDRDAR